MDDTDDSCTETKAQRKHSYSVVPYFSHFYTLSYTIVKKKKKKAYFFTFDLLLIMLLDSFALHGSKSSPLG